MSSSLSASSSAIPSTAASSAAATNAATAAFNVGNQIIGGSRSGNVVVHNVGAAVNGSNAVLLPPPLCAAQFREIHKNTWLKRLSQDGKKITVGPKKSERSWVVFCVHDDTEALLEGYAEPRQAASHMPEWIVSLQDTSHISHALISNLHEFEFVVTMKHSEVLRFHAMSWEIMQEWVETLRSKLREMKIISPRENLYTKLPEVRAPLLPTRDPTSPLPAPPPVPAAIVPGVETPPSTTATTATTTVMSSETNSTNSISATTNTTTTTMATTIAGTTTTTTTTASNSVATTLPNITSMSNTLTQNLLNMLSDPISTYSEQINESNTTNDNESDDHERLDLAHNNSIEQQSSTSSEQELNLSDDEFLSPLLRKACVLTENGVRVDIDVTGHRASADQLISLEQLMQCERLIPRPQTSRSMSAGAADKTKKLRKINNDAKSKADISITNSTSNTTTDIPSVHSISDTNTNITIIQVSSNENETQNEKTSGGEIENTNIVDVVVYPQTTSPPPKLPTKTISGEIFRFPEITTKNLSKQIKQQHEYKSNVQIIPSNVNSSTIQVLGQSNQYTTPVKNVIAMPVTTTAAAQNISNSTTTVHVIGGSAAAAATATAVSSSDDTVATTSTSVAVYGTCYTPNATAVIATEIVTSTQYRAPTPKLIKKVILTANPSGITNISVNNDSSNDKVRLIGNNVETGVTRINDKSNGTGGNSEVRHNVGNVHYEKVFLSTSMPSRNVTNSDTSGNEQQQTITNNLNNTSDELPQTSNQLQSNRKLLQTTEAAQKYTTTAAAAATTQNRTINSIVGGSPALPRRRIISPSNVQQQQTTSHSNIRTPMLTRGLTEAVISTRPSRRDFHLMKQLLSTPIKTSNKNANKSSNVSSMANNNHERNNIVTSTPMPTTSSSSSGTSGACAVSTTPVHAALNRATAAAVLESMEQRRRSSSTSDAHAPLQRTPQRGTNNNELTASAGISRNAVLRMQQPPQPYRYVEHGSITNNATSSALQQIGINNSAAGAMPPKRLTLREQQVMQLRREIMHPGGVRLQLRRKDCIGSIAWVDAFGAVWVAGWKQKEHPVLYNALHIGDQLISIAGVNISNAAEANKIIRNTNTLFLEVLVRRIPFGRVYAIRRDREMQCLGLIRDGNTSTIVDVVPNSLAARHGLPPKAQSCDGSTLTFWMLTEINGRPLNLFFKDNEIRDRLNSVGRDISILVQPSDLITKLKKQIKSLRGYKDYLVQ